MVSIYAALNTVEDILRSLGSFLIFLLAVLVAVLVVVSTRRVQSREISRNITDKVSPITLYSHTERDRPDTTLTIMNICFMLNRVETMIVVRGKEGTKGR